MTQLLRLLSVSIVFSVAVLTAQQVDAGAIRSGFDDNTLNRNDDGSTGLVGIGFDLNFFGTTFNQLFVNNNGNVTFENPLSSFTPSAIGPSGSGSSGPIIAPFFADVDTRGPGEPVRYGTGTVDGRNAFGVNWVEVGVFASSPPLNSFQLVLTDRSDIAPGDFDIEFNYDQILWDTGSASGNTSAAVGYSNAAGAAFQLPGSFVNDAFFDSNPTTGLINNSRNSNEPGRYVFNARSGGIDPGVVPEPASLAIFSMIALVGVGSRRKRTTV